MLDQHHPSKAARAQSLDPLEVLKACCVLQTSKIIQLSLIRENGKDKKLYR